MEPLKKIWTWVKGNWITLVVIGVVVVVAVLFIQQEISQKKLVDRMMEENQLQFQNHTRDIEEMQNVFARERAAQEAINVRLQEDLQRVQVEYGQRITEIDERTRTRRGNFVRETNGNSDEMARRLGERLGWRVGGNP